MNPLHEQEQKRGSLKMLNKTQVLSVESLLSTLR
jgi:hypothetical protein